MLTKIQVKLHCVLEEMDNVMLPCFFIDTFVIFLVACSLKVSYGWGHEWNRWNKRAYMNMDCKIFDAWKVFATMKNVRCARGFQNLDNCQNNYN